MNQDEFFVEGLRRVPVAEGVLSVLAVLFSEDRMSSLFEKHRGASYEGTLSFHTVVGLLYSAVLEHHAVGSQAFKAARSANQMPASDQAAYGKIRRMRQSLSHALISECMSPLMEMFPESVQTQVPRCFNKYNVYGIDGKKLKDIAKRLKETRSVPGKLLGGKALVALSIHEQLVVGISSSLDGEANDGPLVPDLLASVHARTPTLNIFLADSQFCDLTTPRQILAYGSDFVIRYHPKVHFYVDEDLPATGGQDGWGRPYVEEIGWLGKPGTKTCIRVRRIIVQRQDKPELIIVTSLLDSGKFSAADVLELYGLRWTIETAFQHVTKEFDLRHMIGSTAEATIFQFSISLIIYNIMKLIQAHASEAKGVSPVELSLPKIIRTAKKQIISISTFVSTQKTADLILNKQPTTTRVSKLLGKLWDDDWIKAPKNKRNQKPPLKKRSGAHTSVYREIKAYNEQKDV